MRHQNLQYVFVVNVFLLMLCNDFVASFSVVNGRCLSYNSTFWKSFLYTFFVLMKPENDQ